ncbi:MAG: YeeE/YedE thiosulfate transporter family protein [Planctomycetota bacterium]|nr:YeeE/YedE thiosulfate transporter family protein [Planctomycetota bacterium]
MTLDWPFWIAGACIGGFVPLFALVSGKLLGISSGYSELCSIAKPAGPERWKLWFALGLPLGGFAASGLAGTHRLETVAEPVRAALGVGDVATLALLVVGGALIGYGARTAGGCTSGHSIVGLALGAKSSLVATLGFMAGGFAATWALVALTGGAA